jgi:septum formation protein
MRLILGSGSKWRQQVLRSMGLDFEVLAPDIDEKAVRHDDPEALTLALARAKAAALRSLVTGDAILLTSDQVVVQSGEILEKPLDEAEARLRLEMAASAPIETVCAIVATDLTTGREAWGIDRVRVLMRPLPPEVIETLIKEGRVYDTAGGFQIEHPLVAPHVASLKGELESVMGLSPNLTRRLLRELGFPGV